MLFRSVLGTVERGLSFYLNTKINPDFDWDLQNLKI